MTNKSSKKNKIGIFSFFAGAGFLDLGFEKAQGYDVLFVNEFHKPFMDIYKSSRKNLNIETPIFGHDTDDICSFLNDEKSKSLKINIEFSKNNYDLIGFIGGPPCPDFSVGGKNKGINGENGKLSATYFELISQNEPDFFLFENVKGLYRTKKHREFFEEMKLKMISNGYYLTEKLINSLEYGVPQNRERIILLGFKRNALTKLGMKLNGSPFLKSFNWNSKTIYNIEEIFSKKWPSLEPFEENSIKPMPKEIFKKLSVQYWFEKNDVNNHPNSKHFFKPRTGLVKFLSIQEGDDLKKSYKRLHRWRYSPTAAYGNNEVHLHPYRPRRISVAEALAIQSLPKEYIIPDDISLSNMFKTIGNGVPYLAAKGLAESILEFIQKIKTEELKYAEINSK